MGSRARRRAFARHGPRGECGMPAVPREAPDPTSIPILLFPGPRRRPARPLLIYPPAGAQWSPRPGGLSGGFPDPAKLIWVRSAKNGLASSRAREMQRGDPGPWPGTRRPRAGRSTLDRLPWTVYPGPSTLDRPPSRRPVYPAPSRLPCAAPPALPPSPPSQSVYPAPADPSTLYPMTRLPCTARPAAAPSTQVPPPKPSTLHRPPSHPPVYPGLFYLLYTSIQKTNLWHLTSHSLLDNVFYQCLYLVVCFASLGSSKCPTRKRQRKIPPSLNTSKPTARFLYISTLPSRTTPHLYYFPPQRDRFGRVRHLYGQAC